MSRRYVATLTAEFVIEAENIAHARKAAKAIRAIGERVGVGLPGFHDRDMVVHRIDKVLETVRVSRGGEKP